MEKSALVNIAFVLPWLEVYKYMWTGNEKKNENKTSTNQTNKTNAKKSNRIKKKDIFHKHKIYHTVSTVFAPYQFQVMSDQRSFSIFFEKKKLNYEIFTKINHNKWMVDIKLIDLFGFEFIFLNHTQPESF